MTTAIKTTASQLSRLKLKSFKFVKWMSEETSCFTATVLLDGKAIGTAENDGHGGSTLVRFSSIAAQETASAFATTILPADVAGWEFLLAFAFDDLVDITVDRELKQKEIDAIRRKALKNAEFVTETMVKGSSLKFKTVTDLNRKKCVALAKASIGYKQMVADMTDEEIVSWFMS